MPVMPAKETRLLQVPQSSLNIGYITQMIKERIGVEEDEAHENGVLIDNDEVIICVAAEEEKLVRMTLSKWV